MTVNGTTTVLGGIYNGSSAAQNFNGGLFVSGGTVTLAGAASYNSTTTVSAGTLNISIAAALGTSTLFLTGGNFDNTSGGTLTLTNNMNWNGSFTFIGSSAITFSTGNVSLAGNSTISVSANTLTVGGIISGSGNLTKTGAGTLVLTGNNTYTGTTSIIGGTLSAGNIVVVGGHSNLGNALSAVTIENGAILSYTGGSATYTRGFTIDNGVGELDNTGVGLLTLSTNNVATSGGATFTVGSTGNVALSNTSLITGSGSVG